MRNNMNRGYKRLRVWNLAIEYYVLNTKQFQNFPYAQSRIISNHLDSVDSLHRNIAEGYCRRSINEYVRFLNIGLSSLGESVSGLHAFHSAGQISDEKFNELDTLAYEIENGMIKLIRSLKEKRDNKEWQDDYKIRETNEMYGNNVEL